jgi:RES domain-containing protein
MPVNPALATTIAAGGPYFRITPVSYRTSNAGLHKRVVDGLGAVKSLQGARYNHPGVRTVYLAGDLDTCLAERMFYFHREVLSRLDALHLSFATGVPAFTQTFVLWEVQLKTDVADIFLLNTASASFVGVFPCLMLNPSQDYHHLKDRRAAIQHAGYNGLVAPSSRSTAGGQLIVLFDDQSKNVAAIRPFDAEFSLLTTTPPLTRFTNHAVDSLDYTAGAARLPGNPGGGYSTWTRVNFNH